jgi:hypothetical protein
VSGKKWVPSSRRTTWESREKANPRGTFAREKKKRFTRSRTPNVRCRVSLLRLLGLRLLSANQSYRTILSRVPVLGWWELRIVLASQGFRTEPWLVSRKMPKSTGPAGLATYPDDKREASGVFVCLACDGQRPFLLLVPTNSDDDFTVTSLDENRMPP